MVVKRILLACLLSLLAAPLVQAAEDAPATTRVLKVRVAAFPPFYFRDAQGRWTGLDTELGQALIQRAGLQPHFEERPWSRALLEMKNGNMQVMMNLARTPERSAYLYWIGPERYSQMALVVRQKDRDLRIDGIDDLPATARTHHQNFGLQQHVSYSPVLDRRLRDATFARYFEYISRPELNAEKLKAGRIIGFFEDRDAMAYEIAHNPHYKGLALHGFMLEPVPVYFGISKRGVDAATLQKLQQAYQELVADGTFQRIINAWQ
ncbi:substrate-binding periplasmic protein [Mangrovitalea sediminis]|uniref:substrate-binding periplasmic protein n=1 Tax=Mangrovitalea sediminis TaxID=1982043 RepID=UPI000BE6033B|nr:transporter substrate-binding domain-containing protein [Mangrovitalea sediminis]